MEICDIDVQAMTCALGHPPSNETLETVRAITGSGVGAATFGGMKTGLENGAAVLSSAPDYVGQLAVAKDGYIARSNGTTAGAWTGNMVLGAPVVYFTTLHKGGQSGAITAGKIIGQSSGVEAMHRLEVSGSTFVDNVLYLRNSTDNGAGAKGYTAIQMMHADDNQQYAVGIAPDNTADYANSAYMETNNDPVTLPAPSIGFWQFQDNGSGPLSHRRIYMDGAAKTITLYGWSNSDNEGPLGLVVDEDGHVSIGTSDIVGGNRLTVGGSLAGIGYTDRTDAAKGWTTYADNYELNLLDTTDFKGLVIGSVFGTFYVRSSGNEITDLGRADFRWKTVYTKDIDVSAASTPPADTANPAAWMAVKVAGVTYKTPLFQ